MDVFTTCLLSLLYLEVIITYAFGIAYAHQTVKLLGGVTKEDLHDPEFWLFTVGVLLSPITIPICVAIDLYKNGL